MKAVLKRVCLSNYPSVMEVLRMNETKEKFSKAPITKQQKVWFVSENPADRNLLELAMDELGLNTEFVFVKGEEEMDAMLKNDALAIPDIIFLDYYLSRLTGVELLQNIRLHHLFQEVPVVMMMPAMFERILWESYEEGANCCILLPVDFFELIDTLKGVLNYWNFMKKTQ